MRKENAILQHPKKYSLMFVEVATGTTVTDQDDQNDQSDEQAQNDKTPKQGRVFLFQNFLWNEK